MRTSRKGDRSGIYSFGKNGELHAAQELTDDSQLLGKAANTLKAMDPYYRTQDTTGMSDHAASAFSTETVLEQVAVTKRVLTTIARHLAKVPGRKNLIWITTAFPLSVEGVDFKPDVEQGFPGTQRCEYRSLHGGCSRPDWRFTGTHRGTQCRVRGPGSQRQLLMQMGRRESASPRGLDTENMFANLTGGLVFYNKSNAIEDSIQSAVNDGELTYTLGFYPAEESKEGTWHDLKVAVDRRGVSVRYRRNYLASGVVTSANEGPTLEALLNDPFDGTQLELVAETTPDHAQVTIDLHDVHLEKQNGTWVVVSMSRSWSRARAQPALSQGSWKSRIQNSRQLLKRASL